MTAIKGYFSALAAIVTSLTRSAFGIALLLLFVLCIPLSAATLMRFFDWQWWIALPAALLLLFIPILGWGGLLVLAAIGCFHLIGSGFNWDAATRTANTPRSFATMTIMEFDDYRRNIMPQGLAKACKEAQSKLLGTGDQLPVRVAIYCDCYGQTSADTLTQADLAEHEKNGAYSEDATNRMRDAVRSHCGS